MVIVDFNSTDVDIFKLRENSDIKDRFVQIVSTYLLLQFRHCVERIVCYVYIHERQKQTVYLRNSKKVLN